MSVELTHPHLADFQVDVTVVDKNDNVPEFVFSEDILSSNQFLVSIQDNTPAGSNIIQIQVGCQNSTNLLLKTL